MEWKKNNLLRGYSDSNFVNFFIPLAFSPVRAENFCVSTMKVKGLFSPLFLFFIYYIHNLASKQRKVV
ncbi:hypothetical protein OIU77_000460 [Salix suchowensis]|uniref:Uncharacterized protein n=1 Tax=Salix suchowensis TaxID=1278906 RepID=A0ABQ9B7Y1_9ROSI|nr:hypothetical protein OIU77_000460 [Salix suchowensis]